MNRYQKYRFRMCKKVMKLHTETTGIKLSIKDGWRFFKEAERDALNELGIHRKHMELDKMRGVRND